MTVVSFALLVTGLALGAGLLVTLLGIPVAAATLGTAVAFGTVERRRLALQGTALPPVEYAPVEGIRPRAMLARLTDPVRWAAALHGTGALALSVATFTVAVTWWAGTLGGLTYWFWERWLPAPGPGETRGLVELLDLPVSEAVLNLLLGVVFLLTLPFVLRACVALHAGWARLLLTGTSRRALAAHVADLTARRSAAEAAEAASLRRLERDIHDGPQQRLVRLGMDLAAAERRLADDPDAVRELLGTARAQTAETLEELRALSRGIAPPVLVDRGLVAAVRAVAGRCPVPTTVTAVLPDGDRPSAAVESAAYFVCAEALTNVAKHAAASAAHVELRGDDGVSHAAGVGSPVSASRPTLVVLVRDDGAGGASLGKGHGLAGLAERVEGVGGAFTVTSSAGGPTEVRAVLPWR